jgi:DNA-binding IclR family transcriptional regulator
METASTVIRALDLLTVLAGRRAGLTLPAIAQALNQPRTNVVRLLHSFQLYGFVRREGGLWCVTAASARWIQGMPRHEMARRRYRTVLEQIAEATGELVLLGLHEGNGVVHIDYIECDRRIRIAPAPDTRHGLRHNALGKLALSRRPDLAGRIRDARLQAELAEIRRTGIAWNREETVIGMVAMACSGFENTTTEPMLAVAWPTVRDSARKGEAVFRAIADALASSKSAGQKRGEDV